MTTARRPDYRRPSLLGSTVALGLMFGAGGATAATINTGNLVVSKLTYTGTASTVVVGQSLPGGGTAIADGSFPDVFNNVTVDGNFGVTAPVTLERYALNRTATRATKVGSQILPTDQFVGSFSSKSEGALTRSVDGRSLTIGGYVAVPNQLDVSNSNTPGHIDPTNPDKQVFQRAVAEIGSGGAVKVTGINAYSGDNIRATIKAGSGYYTVGNSNNGKGTDASIVSTTGLQFSTPGVGGETTKVGSYSITQNGYPADKPGKDDNLRGVTVFDNTIYVTKGSGSNGIDTVYQVGAAGSLPTGSGNPVAILHGFPTGLAKSNAANFYPFGLWFANATTLYVADEGDGEFADAATNPNAGLSKWTLANGTWTRDYVLQAGLDLGIAYGVDGLPTSLNPLTAGLRNIIGRTNADGTVTIFGITSTVSNNPEPGADPTRLVAINDLLASTALPADERFTVLQTAGYGEVLRGVAFAAGVPEPASWAMMIGGFGAIGGALRHRRTTAFA